MTVNDASLGESGSKLSKVAATSLLMGVTRASSEAYGNTVYYTFAQDFSLQSNVERAINEWENKTSLTFVNGTGYGNYIEFFHGSGNYSYLGTCFSY